MRLFLLTVLSLPLVADSRFDIEVEAAGVERVDKIVEATIPADAATASLVEVDANGNVIDPAVPFQWDDLLTFVLAGKTPAGGKRRYELRLGSEPAKPVRTRVLLSHVDRYEGFPAFKITTPRATWYYHKRSSGFASLIDNDGNDWIGYHPTGGFQGNYRGIPNIAPPQFHPGRPDGKKPTRIVRQGPLRVTLASETEDGRWATLWDIYPHYARMTLTKKGAEPYWILYEGTPGGSFDVETDYWVHSDGTRLLVQPNDDRNRWNNRLPDPQWVWFGDTNMERVLFFALDPPDREWDMFWHRGSGGMTVFGFGRGPRPQWQYLQSVPAHLTIGLVEENEFGNVLGKVASAVRPIRIRVQ